MITLILTAGVGGLMAWAVWKKKYGQAFLLLTPLFGIYSCVVGLWVIHQNNVWPGMVLIALGLGTLVYVDKYRGKV